MVTNMTTRDERNKFSAVIEERIIKDNVSTMEAIINYCEETGLELEIAGSLVNSVLKTKIEEEAKKLRYLKSK